MKIVFRKKISLQLSFDKISLAVLLGATLIAALFPPQTLGVVEQFRVKELSVLPAVGPKTIITQTFKATGDYDGFGLLFANYQAILESGAIEIKISNQQNLVGTCSVEAKNLTDMTFFYCEVIIVEGQEYELSITTADLSSPITFLTTTAPISDASLEINQTPQKQLIIMEFLERRNDYMLAWGFAVLANLVACYLAANIKKESHESKKA